MQSLITLREPEEDVRSVVIEAVIGQAANAVASVKDILPVRY